MAQLMNTGKEMKVSLVALFPWVSVSTPVISTTKYFLLQGCKVDLYVSPSKMLKEYALPAFLLSDLNLQVIPYTSSNRYKKPWSTLLRIYHFFKGIHSSDAIEFAFTFRKKRYDISIGYDASGIEHAYLANHFWKSTLIYHNLEFHESDDRLKKAEIKICNNISCILTQSDLRVKILARINQCAVENFKVLYNSSYLEKDNRSEHYFNDLFHLDQSKFLVLMNGSIIPETCVMETLETLSKWPPNSVLIMHGWCPHQSLRDEIEKYRNEFPDKLFLSHNFIDFEHKLKLFRSVQLVLVFYHSTDENHSSAAGSSGKFYDALMTGRPVVANNIEGMAEMIVPGNLGYVIKSMDELPHAISLSMKNHAVLSQNAYHAFDQYSFSSSMDKVLEDLLNKHQ
jgi:glycosyltransferase involved in cell wall biosynthesis